MILSLEKEFKDPILKGVKKHIIRENFPELCKAGTSIKIATSVSTKQYVCYKEAVCQSAQIIRIDYSIGEVWTIITVFIDYNWFGTIYINDGEIHDYTDCMEELIINDGFDSLQDFIRYYGRDFEGKIIHWTDLLYS